MKPKPTEREVETSNIIVEAHFTPSKAPSKVWLRETIAQALATYGEEREKKGREEMRGELVKVRPSRRTMKHKLGDWYECGWNDAVVEQAKAIESYQGGQDE